MELVYRYKGRPERPTLNEGEAYRRSRRDDAHRRAIETCLAHVGKSVLVGIPSRGSEKLIGDYFEVLGPLDDGHVLIQVSFADTLEGSQEGLHARPQSFQGVAMDFAHSASVVVDCPGPFRSRMVHCPVNPTMPLPHTLVPVPFIGVHHGPFEAGPVDDLLQLAASSRLDHIQADFPRLASHHTDDRRSIVGEGAVTTTTVGPSPWGICQIPMGDAFLPGILIHLVGLDDGITQGVPLANDGRPCGATEGRSAPPT